MDLKIAGHPNYLMMTFLRCWQSSINKGSISIDIYILLLDGYDLKIIILRNR